TGQRVAGGPCPRLSSGPAIHAFRPTFQWPLSQLAPGVPRLLHSGVSSPKDTRMHDQCEMLKVVPIGTVHTFPTLHLGFTRLHEGLCLQDFSTAWLSGLT